MKAIFISGLSFLAAAAVTTPTNASADAACNPRVVQSDTKFPVRSQLRNQTGTVYINVTVDETGRAQNAAIHESSGYRLLDRAAKQSVVENWVFDVGSCTRKDLPANHLVAVEYRNDTY